MNVFFALKGSKLFIIIYYHCSWMSCRVAAVKSLPALIYSADYIFLLVLWDNGMYSEISEMIIRLESSLNKFEIFWYFSTYTSLCDDCHVKICKLTVFSSGSFWEIWTGHWWGLNSRNRGMAQLIFLWMFSLLLKDLNFYLYLLLWSVFWHYIF